MIGVGFIGLGGMGRLQASAFSNVPGCRVIAGADLSEPSRSQFALQYPNAKVYEDYQTLLANPAVNAVVIAVPTGLHLKVAGDVLRASKPTLLEKPMARTVAQCKQLIQISQRSKTLLMVAHCRRYDPAWGAVKKAVDAGRLGSPLLWRHVRARHQIQGWYMDDQLGGGPMFDGAIHDYDFGNYLFGEPQSVIAASVKMDPKVTAIDTATAVVRYRNGNQLMVSWSWRAAGLTSHDLIGSKGFIQFNPGTLTPPARQKETHGHFCLTNLKEKSRLLAYRKSPGMYVAQARHFLACIQGKARCLTPGQEAIKAVAVGQAILQAAPQGRALPVRW